MRYKSSVWLVTWWNIVYVTAIKSNRSVSNGKVTQEDTVTIRPTSSEHQKNFTEVLTEDLHILLKIFTGVYQKDPAKNLIFVKQLCFEKSIEEVLRA